MHIIFGNFANGTIGLMRWAYEQSLTEVYVVSVETHWASPCWQQRVEQAKQLCEAYGFKWQRISSPLGFADIVAQRQDFPSKKFQWCAGLLKGLPLLTWLDELDPACEATVLMGRRRLDSPVEANLPEYIEESEHMGERRVWHPLYAHSDSALQQLVAKTPLALLKHRSFECAPCPLSNQYDLAQLADADVVKTTALEQQIGKTLFNIQDYCAHAEAGSDFAALIQAIRAENSTKQEKNSDTSNGNCGSPFGCGI